MNVGTKLRSKINGDVFVVVDCFIDNGCELMKIEHVKSGNVVVMSKRTFVHGVSKNLEIVEGD